MAEPAAELLVAVATYRRPVSLARLLPELAAQVGAYPGPAQILVVDNDPAAGARVQVQAWADRGVAYRHEPQPGIAAARNAAIEGSGTARLLVFVDDDGLPLPGWLERLVATWERWRPAAVSGPQLARFDGPEPDAWVVGSGVFDRTARPTGTLVGGASTANLLLDLDRLRAHGLAFDEAFGLSGGSDTMLTHALVAAGEQIRWCDEAEVLDFHSPDRVGRAWVRRRCYRTGNDWSRVALALGPAGPGRALERAELLARGAVRATTGLANQFRGLTTRDALRVGRGAGQVRTGLGMAAGAVGVVGVEYARPAVRG